MFVGFRCIAYQWNLELFMYTVYVCAAVIIENNSHSFGTG